MPSSVRPLFRLGLIVFLVPQFLMTSAAQNSAISNMSRLARDSGYIFDGTVLSVDRRAEVEAGSVATVQVTFRVEQAIRGARNGQVLTIREWAGLWSSGNRYRPGERLLMFLYGPSKLGLTSPVGGPLGRFSVDSSGNVILDTQKLAALSTGPGSPTLSSPDPASPTRRPVKNRVSSRTLALAIQRAATY
jgi:hypothetical protein